MFGKISLDAALRWFEYWLQGKDNGIMSEPAVRYYVMGDVTDPEGPAMGEVRVLRGGAWWSPVHACRSARRYSASPAAVLHI